MADIFDDFSNLTLNAEEARADNELIKVNPYYTPEVQAVHAVQTGVMMDKFIPILGQIDDIGILDPGTCGVNTFVSAIPVSQKKWEPKLISARVPICKDNFPALFKAWMEKNIASKRWEDINDALKQFVLDKVQEATTRAIIRVADFADTAADVVANGGYLTAGTNKALFTMLDGMWKQIFTDGAGAGLIYRYSITENQEALVADQLLLADDTAFKVFEALITNIPPEAQTGALKIQCTKTLWENWRKYVIKQGGAFNTDLLTKGMSEKTYGGYDLIVRSDWDRIIKKDFNQGANLYLPHRAILSDLNNIPVGTSDTESFSALDSFYDKTAKTHYTDVAWREDCKILQENSIAVAY